MNQYSKEKITQETKFFIGFILFTVFSGAIRKWLIDDKSIGNFIFSLQLLSPFIFLFTPGNFKSFNSRVLGLFLLYLLLCAFNPLNLTIYHGLIGILIHFNIWFLLFYYYYNKERIQLSKLITPLIIICYGEIVLGYVQYGLPAGHFLNSYADVEAVGGSYASVGDAVRVTGTFSYISGYTSFLLFFTFFVWALVKLQYKNLITFTLLFMGLVGAFMSGSRAATFIYLIFVLYIFFFEVGRQYISQVLISLFVPLLILLLFLNFRSDAGLTDRVVKAYENFVERREKNKESGEEQQRLFWDFEQLSNLQFDYKTFGVGLGSTYQGAIAIYGKSDYVKQAGYLETENTRVVVEGGYILLLFRLILIISMLYLFQFAMRDSIFIFFFMVFLGGYAYNVYNAIFIFLGLVVVHKASEYQKRMKRGHA